MPVEEVLRTSSAKRLRFASRLGCPPEAGSSALALRATGSSTLHAADEHRQERLRRFCGGTLRDFFGRPYYAHPPALADRRLRFNAAYGRPAAIAERRMKLFCPSALPKELPSALFRSCHTMNA